MFKNAVNIEVAVFSRGVPITNQFQVVMYLHFFSSSIDICLSCIDICFQVVIYKLLQVGTRCLCVAICLQVVTRFTSCYNVLQVHVSPRSEVTFGNDVVHRNSTAKRGSKFILDTTTVVCD